MPKFTLPSPIGELPDGPGFRVGEFIADIEATLDCIAENEDRVQAEADEQGLDVGRMIAAILAAHITEAWLVTPRSSAN